MYFGYFLQVLKQPYASTHNVGAEHLINGIITMVLYAFLIPFTLYFIIKKQQIVFQGIRVIISVLPRQLSSHLQMLC